jgi:DNA-binding transcriptional LysR family regulator
MQTFVRVVEAGGFGRAADLMQIPRARVTQRIQALENALGVRLLQRTTLSMQITPEGSSYYDQCVQLLASIENRSGSVNLNN